mmetsp:Transcript_34965/g.56140  ORF Transcript_34965/g.56140 Transcript_34965/m.56140 type:complete len:147 (+) Transcript_34965:19-459(+)
MPNLYKAMKLSSILWLIYAINHVHAKDDDDTGSEDKSTPVTPESVWKNTAISSLFLLVIIISVLAYIISINKRLKRRVRTLEQLCISHGIAKDKTYPYSLSSDDEYDELNPFLTKSDAEDTSNPLDKNQSNIDAEYDNIDNKHTIY